MRDLSLTRALLTPALLALLAPSCLKATTPPGQGAAAGGGSAVGNGTGGTSGNGTPGTGAGGSGAPTTAGGSGPTATGMGGATGVTIIDNPTGGSGGGAPMSGGGGMGTVVPPAKMACADSANQQGALPYTSGYTISDNAKAQAAATVRTLTTPQKASQMRGLTTTSFNVFNTNDDQGAGVKGFYFSDGPRGVNLDAVKTAGQGYSTVFPAASLRGASFDLDLENQIGAAMGDELIAAGRTMLLAPTVNILRHPAWGRAEETYGEDSFLLGRLGSAFVLGVQTYAPACVKHFAANNIETNRANDIAQMDEQTLQEVYARHYGMIVKDGGVSCVMAAYNEISAPPSAPPLNCTQNKHLLTDILRTEFGFQGMVLSDWWAMPGGSTATGTDAAATATQALLAGMDMELPWNHYYINLESIASANSANLAALTLSAGRVLAEKYRFKVNSLTGAVGLKTPTSSFNSGTFSIGNNADHIALAQKSALEGMVLLKNDNKTLPIKSDGTIKTVAVVGLKVAWSLAGVKSTGTVDFPVDARIGDLGSSRVNMDPGKAIGPVAGITAAAPAGVKVVMDDTGGTAVAQAADFVVVVAGLTPQDEGEEYTITPEDSDRDKSLALDGKKPGTSPQNTYIKAIAALGKPTVVVLEGGSVIDVSSFVTNVPAIVMAWYPGQSGGAALGSLLFGKSNFSGKLPITWPVSIADEPQWSGSNNTTLMGYYLGYRWFDNQKKTPLYPFGHGLSYATFTYSNLQVPCSTVTKGGVVNATVDVTNTGTVDGDETAFLFTSWPSSTVATRANGYKELKGFARATIPAGKTARIPIPIRVSDLNYWDTASNSWKVESGPVQVMVGSDSSKLTLMDTFTVQ